MVKCFMRLIRPEKSPLDYLTKWKPVGTFQRTASVECNGWGGGKIEGVGGVLGGGTGHSMCGQLFGKV